MPMTNAEQKKFLNLIHDLKLKYPLQIQTGENTMTAEKCQAGQHNYVATNNQTKDGNYVVLQMTCTKCGDIIKPNEVKE